MCPKGGVINEGVRTAWSVSDAVGVRTAWSVSEAVGQMRVLLTFLAKSRGEPSPAV